MYFEFGRFFSKDTENKADGVLESTKNRKRAACLLVIGP